MAEIRGSSFTERLAAVTERIAQAAGRAGRRAEDVKIVAVTKGSTASAVSEAFAAGMRIFGENKVQEALTKVPQFPDAEWHMIGHLQTNKAKAAAGLFKMVQSIDSVRVAEALSRERTERELDVLLEVNISGESQKYGFAPDDVYSAVDAVSALPNIRICGLMGMAPHGVTDDLKRASFKKLKGLFGVCRSIKKANVEMRYLSMGMSDDFEIAVEEGSNMLRLGRVLFS